MLVHVQALCRCGEQCLSSMHCPVFVGCLVEELGTVQPADSACDSLCMPDHRHHKLPLGSYNALQSYAGTIMTCDGRCLRSMHCGVERVYTSPDDEEGTLQPVNGVCNPLGIPHDLYYKLTTSSKHFKCPNCVTGVYQCFRCHEEGLAQTRTARQTAEYPGWQVKKRVFQ